MGRVFLTFCEGIKQENKINEQSLTVQTIFEIKIPLSTRWFEDRQLENVWSQ